MPLVDLAAAPSGLEEFKAATAYGLHKSYPVALPIRDDDIVAGVSGLGDDPVMFAETDKGWVNDRIKRVKKDAKNQRFLSLLNGLINEQKWNDAKTLIMYYFKHPELKQPDPRYVAVLSSSGAAPIAYAPSIGPIGASARGRRFSGLSDIADLACGCKKCQSGLGTTPEQCAIMLDDPSVTSKAYISAGCQDGGARPTTGNKVVDSFNQIFGTIFGAGQSVMAARANRPPKQKVVVQAAPDWTTPAVIVGGAIVASVLALALAKGRK